MIRPIVGASQFSATVTTENELIFCSGGNQVNIRKINQQMEVISFGTMMTPSPGANCSGVYYWDIPSTTKILVTSTQDVGVVAKFYYMSSAGRIFGEGATVIESFDADFTIAGFHMGKGAVHYAAATSNSDGQIIKFTADEEFVGCSEREIKIDAKNAWIFPTEETTHIEETFKGSYTDYIKVYTS